MKPHKILTGLTLLAAWILVAIPVQAEYEIQFEKDVMMPMRDGVKLAANIFRPKADGKFPVLLARSPYGKGDEKQGDGLRYVPKGYVVIIQDCRGKGSSEGEWEPFKYDRDDGHDTYKWIVEQPWSNGEIGTFSGSYLGFTQWISAPGSECVKAMFPVVPLIDPYADACYDGGAFNLSLSFTWGAMVSVKKDEKLPQIDWAEAHRVLPLFTWDEKVTGRKVQYLRDWVTHTCFDDYWAERSARNHLADITAPMLNIAGWYDIFSRNDLENVNKVRNSAKSEVARKQARILVGPWTHGISNNGKVGQMDFGKQSVIDLGDLQEKWFEHWLKGKDTGVENLAPFRIFVMGRNEWRDEQEWPLARAQYIPYYFHSNGSANTLHGDGVLSTKPLGAEPADDYVYHPDDPVPTLGGNNLSGPAGPTDQRKVEERADVLVYTSAELKEELEVTGPVKVVLYASSSAKDTDWTAKLVDVHPDGRAINLCDGIIRARCRESVENPTLIEPGKIYQYNIDVWVTSNVFLPGHRVRVEISSSNFPRYDRNPNTGHPFAQEVDLRKADQRVYHDRDHPSHILLPVIPKG
jgi:hypothetical protein